MEKTTGSTGSTGEGCTERIRAASASEWTSLGARWRSRLVETEYLIVVLFPSSAWERAFEKLCFMRRRLARWKRSFALDVPKRRLHEAGLARTHENRHCGSFSGYFHGSLETMLNDDDYIL
jgi:hypothetical protein